MTADACTASEYDAFAPYLRRVHGGVRLRGVGAGDARAGSAPRPARRRLLDLACGTGKSFLPFAERGFEVTGCDSSSAMLAEAARRAPGVRLVHADIRALPRLGRFDLVTCFDDSLNYLLSEREQAAGFAGIEASLDVAGIALFDLNSLLAYRTTFASDSVSEDDGVV